MLPPKPLSLFAPHQAIMSFNFNYNINFEPYSDAYRKDKPDELGPKLGTI
jgi:hypothetical protein